MSLHRKQSKAFFVLKGESVVDHSNQMVEEISLEL